MLLWLSHLDGGMLLHDAFRINCKKGATTENEGSGVQVYGLRGVS